MSWFVYILKCADDSLYTGVTTELKRREKEHNAGTGAKYTRNRTPVEIVYSEPAADRSAACRREAAIKKLTRSKKLQLIQSDKE